MSFIDSVKSGWTRIFGDSHPQQMDEGQRLITDGGAIERAPTPASKGSTASASMLMRGDVAPRKGAAAVLKSYRTSPWLRAATGRAASTIAAVGWHLVVGMSAGGTFEKIRSWARRLAAGKRHRQMERMMRAEEVMEVERHPLIDLMNKPNPYMDGRVFRQLLVATYKLIGEVAVVLDGDEGSKPSVMYPIPGTWVTRKPIVGDPYWEINVGGGGNKWMIPDERVLWFCDADPSSPYGRGTGIGYSLADEIDVDEGAAKTLNAWFNNRAMPAAIISMKGVKPSLLERAKREWNNLRQGFGKAWGNHWTNSEIDVKVLDISFKDQQLVELRKAQRDIIQQTSGTPPEKMGIVTNSNKATALAASIIDATDVQVPMLEIMREQFNRLARIFDERLEWEYDNPIPQDVEAQRALYASTPWLATVNEGREMIDLPPGSEEDGYDGFIVNGRWFARPIDINAPATAGTATIEEDQGVQADDVDITPPADDAENESDETDDEPDVDTKKGRKRAGAPKLSSQDINHVLSHVDVESMHSAMLPVVRSMVETFGVGAIKEVGADGDFDMDSSKVRAHLRALGTVRVAKMINPTTKDELKYALEKAVAEHEHDNENAAPGRRSFADEVTDAFNAVFERARETRALGIAQTESTRSSSFGTVEGLGQSGITVEKEWIATMDDLVRDAHAELDGQRQPPDEPFVVPAGEDAGAEAMYPGDFGDGALDINCRCAVGTVVDGAGEEAGHVHKRLLIGSRLVAPADKEARADAWRAHNAALSKWDKKLSAAVRDGFDAQQVSCAAALREVL